MGWFSQQLPGQQLICYVGVHEISFAIIISGASFIFGYVDSIQSYSFFPIGTLPGVAIHVYLCCLFSRQLDLSSLPVTSG